jgi:hypothetical protein
LFAVVNTEISVLARIKDGALESSMQYRVLLNREFGSPNPTPADWHDSLESLEATINSLANDGWTFPNAVIEEMSEDGFPHHRLYRLHQGTNENPGLLAVKP